MPNKVIDLAGKKFGKLTVVSFNKTRKGQGALWNCICDCGESCVVLAANLKKGATRSCGCVRKETSTGNTNKRMGFGESLLNHMFGKYRWRARKKGWVFELTKSDFAAITKDNCYYCGTPPEQILKRPDHYGEYVYNGVDRFCNSLGYTKENSVPCCGRCNRAKMDMDGPEYLALCRRVSNHWNNREMETRKAV